jgi:hypothetical protein
MISLEEFRTLDGYADLRAQVGEFLRSEAGMFVLRILRDRGRPHDVPTPSDSLCSARVLSQMHGYNAAVDDLEELQHPLHVGPQVESTFGAGETDHA